MSFEHTIQVRFQDVDAAGVLFYGRVYDYGHVAYEEFWASMGVDRAWVFSGAEFLIPIAHSEADYRKPVLHGERVTVRIEVTRVGRASFSLSYRISGPAGPTDVRAEVKTVHAFVDKASMKPIPIPENLRVLLLRHLVQEPVAHHPAQ
jgi:YbgC/YbaW family acyl-CoA thioester hydrolase